MGWPKGKERSEETRQKLSEAHMKRVLSEEYIKKRAEKLADAKYGKLGGGRDKGYKLSEEHKQKISEASKKNKKTEQFTFIDENGNEQTLDQNNSKAGIL